jgi:phospholipase/carboxylesterase
VRFGREAHEYLGGIGAEVAYREYPIGHSISEESLDDLSEWLTNKINGI